jgi:flagellar hook-length control protein FliK
VDVIASTQEGAIVDTLLSNSGQVQDIRGPDRLQIEMQVENPHIKQLVESDLEQLRNRFLDKEFNFSEMELTVNIDARSDADSQAFANQGRYQEDETAVSQKQRLNSAQESASVIRPQTRSDGSLNLYA